MLALPCMPIIQPQPQEYAHVKSMHACTHVRQDCARLHVIWTLAMMRCAAQGENTGHDALRCAR